MRVLHLEENAGDARLVRELILSEWPDCQVTWVDSRVAYVAELQLARCDLILSAYALVSFSGLEALKLAQEQVHGTPFIFVSGTMGEERAIEAMRAGAADCVPKDRLKRLTVVIDRARRDSEERTKHRTERKELEEQFLRAQRMGNIGLLAAGIAHDLNNMLAPILLAAPMLREYVDDASALGLLKTVEESAQRGANLVRQVLAFTRDASGDQRVVQVKHAVRDVSAVIAGTFPKSIRLEEIVPNDLWPIKVNPTQIHQVLLNLSLNARDAMPDGGTLRLRAENRILDESAAGLIAGGLAGAYLVLQVEDTGMGILPDVLTRMWEPFFTTKEPGKGTGLGLSTVRSIIEKHNGFIQVTTSIGRGSGFHIFLPAAEDVPAERLSPLLRPPPYGKGELILVVDDERAVRDLTLAALTRNGYRVILAGDGAEAVAVFAQRAGEIRLVLTDLHMPNLDGVMFGRVLRRINPSMKMLVMSGMKLALGNRPDYAPEEFGDGFLAKPFKPEALLARVHDLLRATDAGRVAAPPHPNP
ncbi:MAG: response regulator [Verrucomicrobia bacterium]|nr:response regulator [Verrucomicrobiota bacterium]